MQKYHIELTEADRVELKAHIYGKSRGMVSKKRAKILLDLDESSGRRMYTTKEISARNGISEPTVFSVCKRYETGGLKGVIERKKRDKPPIPAKVTGEVEAHIIATCCSAPPEGFARWSMRMIAEKIVLDGVIDSICNETVRLVLKKRN
jgi:transposase